MTTVKRPIRENIYRAFQVEASAQGGGSSRWAWGSRWKRMAGPGGRAIYFLKIGTFFFHNHTTMIRIRKLKNFPIVPISFKNCLFILWLLWVFTVPQGLSLVATCRLLLLCSTGLSYSEACEILVPRPEIELVSAGRWILKRWTTREVPPITFRAKECSGPRVHPGAQVAHEVIAWVICSRCLAVLSFLILIFSLLTVPQFRFVGLDSAYAFWAGKKCGNFPLQECNHFILKVFLI